MNKEKESAEILDAKLYLKEIGRYEKVIKNKLEELKHLRELAVSFNHNSNSDVVQNSCAADKIGSTVGQIIDKENELKSIIDDYISKRQKRISVIEELKDPVEYEE